MHHYCLVNVFQFVLAALEMMIEMVMDYLFHHLPLNLLVMVIQLPICYHFRNHLNYCHFHLCALVLIEMNLLAIHLLVIDLDSLYCVDCYYYCCYYYYRWNFDYLLVWMVMLCLMLIRIRFFSAFFHI